MEARVIDQAKLREFGYVCFGPVMLQFVGWLARTANERDVDTLYFLAREGHFLMAAYEKHLALGLQRGARSVPAKYLLTSRRAIFGAAHKDERSLRVMLEAAPFTGSLHQMLRMRFGEGAVRVAPRDRNIRFPHDRERVLELLLGALPALNEAASEERAAMRRYLDDVGLPRTRHCGLVDLGYSGSIQRHLHEIAGSPRMTGFYFSTTKRVDDWRNERNESRACFGEKCDVKGRNVPVFRHALLLESWLTSPDPQLVRFDARGKPVFAEGGEMQARFRDLQEIDAGVHRYFEDVARIDGTHDDLSSFAQEVMVSALFAKPYGEIVDMLTVEDRFCGNQEIDVRRTFGE